MGEFKRGLKDAQKESLRSQRQFGRSAGRARQFVTGGVSALGLAGAGAAAGAAAAAGIALEGARQRRLAASLRSEASASGRTVSDLGQGITSGQAAALSQVSQQLNELTQGFTQLSTVALGPLQQLLGSISADAGRGLDQAASGLQRFQDRLVGFIQARDAGAIAEERRLAERAAQQREQTIIQQRTSFVQQGTRQAVSFEVR